MDTTTLIAAAGDHLAELRRQQAAEPKDLLELNISPASRGRLQHEIAVRGYIVTAIGSDLTQVTSLSADIKEAIRRRTIVRKLKTSLEADRAQLAGRPRGGFEGDLVWRELDQIDAALAFLAGRCGDDDVTPYALFEAMRKHDCCPSPGVDPWRGAGLLREASATARINELQEKLRQAESRLRSYLPAAPVPVAAAAPDPATTDERIADAAAEAAVS